MDAKQIRTLLRKVAAGKVTTEEALAELRRLPFEDIGFGRLDTHRSLRTGAGEVVFCPSKTIPQIVAILRRFAALKHPVFATRATPDIFAAVKKDLPEARYYEPAGIIAVGVGAYGHTPLRRSRSRQTVLVVSAGTADQAVAEEAAVTAELLGSRVERLYDVGVAGIHRLLHDVKRLQAARVLIVVAGMEGALASVVGGLVSRPVIAVPTSVGYGASFSGIAPLLTMLNSCAPGVAVVNIDNGFGAGFIAHRIANSR